MKVLIGCEFSGVVRDAFINRGHFAMSCDLLETKAIGPHYKGDVFGAIDSNDWDLIVLHPPCTHLCVSGNRHYGEGTPGYQKRLDAAKWTERLWNYAKSKCQRVAMENPVGVINRFIPDIPKPQYIQPWEFGHGETKKTGLWLHGLPKLIPTNIVEGRLDRIHKMPPSEDRGLLRSVTYKGIAEAMASQWGDIKL